MKYILNLEVDEITDLYDIECPKLTSYFLLTTVLA